MWRGFPELLLSFDAHKKVEVIAEQAIGKGVCDWEDVLRVELQKVAVVPFFAEEILPVVPAIVDVVIVTWSEWHSG